MLGFGFKSFSSVIISIKNMYYIVKTKQVYTKCCFA